MAEVIALAGWSPEILAYAYAKYSRSALSIRKSIGEINEDKAGRFLDTYYFNYGHKSIADNAHIPMAFEGISQIAAYELEDEQLWDGQEKSTRYQNFDTNNPFYVPPEIQGTPFETSYLRIANFNLQNYRHYSKACFEWLVANNQKPLDMRQDVYERNLRARAFDVARYWLFNGIYTSVGQYTSARTLENQISRLMSSEYKELCELGQSMKNACISKPFCSEDKNEPPVAPTLVKYTEPNKFIINLRHLLKTEAARWLTWPSEDKKSRYVRLVPGKTLTNCMTNTNELVATLLYQASNYPYHQIYHFVSRIKEKDKLELIQQVLDLRGNHDPLPKAFAIGSRFQFDICMDRGGERDLHRHRNCIQIHQPLTTHRGWDTPDLIKQMMLVENYTNNMVTIKYLIEDLKTSIGTNADYLIPFAFRSGTLYKMHLQQAIYMTELRSSPQGHFSYREIACQMHEQLVEECPFLLGKLRVTPFEQQDILKR